MAIKSYPEAPTPSTVPNNSNPRLSPRQLLTGTQTGVFRIKGAIIVSDGDNDRVIIGNFDV